MKKTTAGLKESSLRYFEAKSDVYAERYSVRANGDVLHLRHRAIVQMVNEMELPPGSRILDLGCGPGFLSFDLARQGYRGVGLDAAPAMIRRCTHQAAADGLSGLWHYQAGDVEALPFRDESFDVAICAGVIEYLPVDEHTLREAGRVLRRGGRLILSVTNKYGYTVSLSAIMHRIQSIPGAMRLWSFVRGVVVGGKYGAMEMGFLPRKHRPEVIRETMAKHGFRIDKDQYLQFTLLPAPFCALYSKLKLRMDERLAVLDRTPVRMLGSCYLMCARKETS